jgi:hypothetical protein
VSCTVTVNALGADSVTSNVTGDPSVAVASATEATGATVPSAIVPVAVSPFAGMAMVNVSEGSSRASATVGTLTVRDVSPGSNVTVVVVAW